jgi:molecular chaperone HtpG
VTKTEFESKEKEKKKKKVAAVEHQWELDNKNKALWTYPHGEVTDDEYDEFYKALTNDYEKHLAVKYFRTECNDVFSIFFLFQNTIFMISLNLRRNLTNKTLFSTCFCHEQLQ